MRRLLPDRRDDRGFTLIEMLVTTGIMTVVLLAVIAATVELYSGTKQADNTAAARDQLDNSFRRLDRELRYASWVSVPGKVGERWYLEYALPTGCRQLRLEGGVLYLASWTLPATTPGTPAAIASDVTVDSGVDPFVLYTAGARPFASASPGTAGMGTEYEIEHQQVRLRFTVRVGTVSLPFDSVFTAQNTSRGTSDLNDCSKGRPAA